MRATAAECWCIAVCVAAIAAAPALAQNGRPTAETGTATQEDICSAQTIGSYNLGVHIGAIFAVLTSSFLGVTLPNLTKLSKRKAIKEIFFAARFLGAGVIIATAFVHLLYESFVQLESPCINLAYQPTGPAVAMAAALLVMIVEFIVMRSLLPQSNANERPQEPINTKSASTSVCDQGGCCTATVEKNLFAPMPDDVDKADLDEAGAMLWDADQRRKYLDLLVIEGGIVFHSVMVGLGLGVADDTGFVPYLVAIVFHQFCDGLAIGTRMALLDFTDQRMKRIYLILIYALITPIGIAIGVGVRQFYNGNDSTTILAIGILDSLSAGVLLYGALVDIIAKDILFGQLMFASRRRVVVAFVALFIGAGAMSLIGQWA